MTKRKKIPHDMQHDMSALRRLILISWIVFITFVLFAIASVVSLLYTGKNLDKLIEHNLVPAIDSSRTALDIGRSLAEVNYILSVCSNKDFSGGGEAGKVLNSLASLADDTNDKILNDSLIQFIDQFESAMTNCQSVRQTKKEISAVNEQLSNTIDSLDKTVADLIIEGRMKGNDTTLLERLTLPITEFMQIQLRLHSLFSNLGDVFFMKELTKKHQLILTTLNDFTLETRVLSGYGKEIEVYGNQINRLLQVLVDLTVQNNQVTEGFISGKQKLQIVQSTLLKHLEAAESLLHVSSQQRAKSLKKNFNWIPFAAFLLIGLPLAIVLFSAQLARSAYTSLKKTWEMRDKSKEKLKKAHKNLEIRVIERTGDLAEANKILKDKIAERIDIEKALKKREFQLTETQKVAKIGSWDLDLITPKLDWSNETFKLFDKDPEDFIPSFDEFARIVHPNDLETMQTRFNNALESDENPYHVEVRIINDSGREWVMEAFGKVTRDDSGKARSIFGTAQDVTEKSLVEALRESEEYLKSIYEAAENIAFVVTDLGGKDTKILDISPGAEKIFHYTRDEVIGKKVAIFHPPEIVEDFPKMQAELFKNKKGYSGETVLVRKSGDQFPALFTIHPKFDKNGKINGTIGVSFDISERKVEEEKYKKTIESSIDGFWIVDRKGNFLEVNQAYSSMIGYSRNELLKMSIMSIEAKEHPKETKERIKKIIKNGSDQFESKHRHKKGHIIDVEVSTTFTQDNGGMFYVFLRNITKRNQMEERLRQAQKMESIGNLAGGIAHDFNNLLYPIIGFAEILKEDLPPDSPEYESVQEIFNAGKRGGELVNQILAFSRQSDHKLQPVLIQKILKEVLKLTRSSIPSDIGIHQDVQQDCGSVMADATQLHQITMNLITNAYHAVENTSGIISVQLKEIIIDEGELKDSSLKSGQYAMISVSDNGLGIPRNTINNIFEPYFTTKEKGKGTGLGLAVVYGIVKEHKGDIKVSSEEGKGTTFNVYIPLIKKPTKHIENDLVPILPTGTESLMLVDDEESVVRLEKQMLERLGYNVSTFSNSLEALETFKSNPNGYDLVISDMTMPGITGDKLAKEILSIKSDMPVIICTGFSERINKVQAEVIGMKGFLKKPVVKSEMAQMVRKVLDEAKVFKGN